MISLLPDSSDEFDVCSWPDAAVASADPTEIVSKRRPAGYQPNTLHFGRSHRSHEIDRSTDHFHRSGLQRRAAA